MLNYECCVNEDINGFLPKNILFGTFLPPAHALSNVTETERCRAQGVGGREQATGDKGEKATSMGQGAMLRPRVL